MAEQIVLKLSVPQDRQQRILRHRLLRDSATRQSQQLVSIYYDNRRLDLRRRQVLLRLRKSGGAWLQTVKRQTSSQAGLTRRAEWESAYAGHFDFSGIDDPALRARISRPRVRERLAPIFETSFRRVTWMLQPAADVAILVMLDRGWIAAGARRAPISELELELLAGDSGDLYALALQLADNATLVPELDSKAERGYRLYLDQSPQPAKAGSLTLEAAADPLEALRLIALDCLAHIQQNHAGALASDDPEYIHQMRVATRRLRAALRLFAPLLPESLADSLLPPLRQLTEVLGRARDLDVLMSQIVAPVAAALPGEPRLTDLAGVVAERLFQARQEAGLALRQPAYGRLMLLAGSSLHQVHGGSATAQDAPSLLQFADRRLRRLQRRVLQLAASARGDHPASLHALRIATKRLRYGVEFFASLLPRRRVQASLALLAALQEDLGQLNDLASAGAVLMACASHDHHLREAVTLVGGWHGPRYAHLLAGIPGLLQDLRRLRLPRLVGKA